MSLKVDLVDGETRKPIDVKVDQLVIAGWTGRDKAAMEAHISELEALGIPRPSRTPIYYRCGASLLTNDDSIEVVGDASSGEVEFVLLSTDQGLIVTVGSDHTDREVEKAGVTISKQLCPKPIGRQAWRFEDVADHWDQLILRSYAVTNGLREPYQEGPVTTMRDPRDLMKGYSGNGELPKGTAMFCGTLAVHGSIRPADRFEIELEDPVLERTLSHSYSVDALRIEE